MSAFNQVLVTRSSFHTYSLCYKDHKLSNVTFFKIIIIDQITLFVVGLVRYALFFVNIHINEIQVLIGVVVVV